jgi:hypothetical protein
VSDPGQGAFRANIGARGCRRRRMLGYGWLGVGVLGTVALGVSARPAWLALLLVVPFTMAALGWLQARAHT